MKIRREVFEVIRVGRLREKYEKSDLVLMGLSYLDPSSLNKLNQQKTFSQDNLS